MHKGYKLNPYRLKTATSKLFENELKLSIQAGSFYQLIQRRFNFVQITVISCFW